MQYMANNNIKKCIEKMDKCLRYQNNGYSDVCLKKRDE